MLKKLPIVTLLISPIIFHTVVINASQAMLHEEEVVTDPYMKGRIQMERQRLHGKVDPNYIVTKRDVMRRDFELAEERNERRRRQENRETLENFRYAAEVTWRVPIVGLITFIACEIAEVVLN